MFGFTTHKRRTFNIEHRTSKWRASTLDLYESRGDSSWARVLEQDLSRANRRWSSASRVATATRVFYVLCNAGFTSPHVWAACDDRPRRRRGRRAVDVLLRESVP